MIIMKRYALTISLLLITLMCFSQEDLILDALKTDYFDVPREKPIGLTIKRSLFESSLVDEDGFILEAGDNGVRTATSNNLDGAKIVGNKFIWTADDIYEASTMHGLMLGNNINYTVKHNYFDRLRYTSVFKGGLEKPMEWTAGAHAYNIHKNTKALTIKGIAGVRIYNNTFYAKDLSPLYHISIEENTGDDPDYPATNTKIKNNIFYQDASIPAFRIRQKSCLQGLECDYNVYYCANRDDREPTFLIEGQSVSWDEWRAMGYDTHSVIVDPKFIDTENFVPLERLNFGTNLGEEHATGLAISAYWEVGEYPDTTQQNGKWQVGAVLYGVSTSITNPDASSHTLDKSDLVLTYPNPSAGIFMLQLPLELVKKTNAINVISLDGKIVYNGIIPLGENSIKIDLSNVSPGFYILSGVNSTFSKKIRIR